MPDGMDFDTSDFDKKFEKVTSKEIPTLAERGLARAAMQHLNDCVMVSPTVPIKEGWLRGSGSIFVNNKFIAESPFGKKGRANRTHAEAQKKTEQVAVIGFNTPYATKLHESKGYHFSEPSSGSQFMTKKLRQFKDIYASIIAGVLRNKS